MCKICFPHLFKVDYDGLRLSSYKHVDCVMLMFSVVDPMSFQNVKKKWFPEIQQHTKGIAIRQGIAIRHSAPSWDYPVIQPHHGAVTAVVLVGTKIDLRRDVDMLKHLKEKNIEPVTEQQGQDLANEIGAVKYVELSSLTSEGLKNVFDEVIRVIMACKDAQGKNVKKAVCSMM